MGRDLGRMHRTPLESRKMRYDNELVSILLCACCKENEKRSI
jgi:hypothetical protein